MYFEKDTQNVKKTNIIYKILYLVNLLQNSSESRLSILFLKQNTVQNTNKNNKNILLDGWLKVFRHIGLATAFIQGLSLKEIQKGRTPPYIIAIIDIKQSETKVMQATFIAMIESIEQQNNQIYAVNNIKLYFWQSNFNKN
ncbi:hypothetical protein IMG5_200530 [Ichthyophthirius multifiliis]|uniref:Uncharacterized protein n=1 Tax=Ichthyophthirius multifiliis TaxID=5932 RepID=G0R5R9_ICHMU|nr:hypothetical protein IMG5_200530 [Ichthyophthirius multifiliis]EGR27177.1 hypothetical protein IMG5_200530 [Ichthyophthirius multifiliis]|eukprot:XP_004024061.1 hypothetical protein IMG5_200530 [Ichthyophthirius multifiliis]